MERDDCIISRTFVRSSNLRCLSKIRMRTDKYLYMRVRVEAFALRIFIAAFYDFAENAYMIL